MSPTIDSVTLKHSPRHRKASHFRGAPSALVNECLATFLKFSEDGKCCIKCLIIIPVK